MSRVEAPIPASSYLAHTSRAFLYHAGVPKRQVFALFFVDEDEEIVSEESSSSSSVYLPKRASNVFIWFAGPAPETINAERLMAEVWKEAGRALVFWGTLVFCFCFESTLYLKWCTK